MTRDEATETERNRCIAICEGWIGAYQDREIQYTTPREYAIGAIEDIVDLIRSGHRPEAASSDGEPSNGKQPLMASRPAPPVPSDPNFSPEPGDEEYVCPILGHCPHWLSKCLTRGCQHPEAIAMRACR